jgi:hypothetical protein
MIACHACGKPGGQDADACAHCGTPWSPQNPRGWNDAWWVRGTMLMGIVLVLLGALIIFLSAGGLN